MMTMLRYTWYVLLAATLLGSAAQAQAEKPPKKDSLVVIHTPYGDMTVLLYRQTPRHRANFLKLAGEGFYDSTKFHRVIKEFMIQGGDPSSKDTTARRTWGNGGPGYTLPAEIVPTLYHRRGVLAAARQSDAINPERESSGSQFYIVQGKPLTEAEVEGVNVRMKRMFPDYNMPADMREAYQTVGGSPWLDRQYTIFGEVIDGMDIIDQVAAQPVSYAGSLPETDIPITMEVLVMKRKKVTKNFDYQYPDQAEDDEEDEDEDDNDEEE
jgi:peptidyl-prolyl cis-trans isomerase B (cyclophilin B)